MADPERAQRARMSTRGSEHDLLTSCLDFQRATMVLKLDGLCDDEARAPLVASGTSLLGLVNHLTAVEYHWFMRRLMQAPEDARYPLGSDGTPGGFQVSGATIEDVVAGYEAQCDVSRGVIKQLGSLDYEAPHPTRGPIILRWVLLHMIEETARHAGHADILRELTDGVAGV
jgi:hypothetical protein